MVNRDISVYYEKLIRAFYFPDEVGMPRLTMPEFGSTHSPRFVFFFCTQQIRHIIISSVTTITRIRIINCRTSRSTVFPCSVIKDLVYEPFNPAAILLFVNSVINLLQSFSASSNIKAAYLPLNDCS